MKDSSRIRDALLDHVNFEAEFAELLPYGTPGKRKCWNSTVHEDRTPSLVYSTKTGGWRCKACGETGDLFTLLHKIKKIPYPVALDQLLTKYGLFDALQDLKRLFTTGGPARFKYYKLVTDQDVLSRMVQASRNWKPKDLEFMKTRYGLTHETIYRWRLGMGPEGRLWLPVIKDDEAWDDRGYPMGRFPSIVNIRKHDIHRRWAKWIDEDKNLLSRPDWMTMDHIARQDFNGLIPHWESGNKVTSQADHGTTYIYPARVWFKEPFVYLTGGELKALLLCQLGLPACSFTTGEGSYAQQLLPWAVGKRIRIIMDPDDAGVRAADKLAAVLAESGAHVEVAIWPPEVTEALPPKGDVTDLLRLADWDKAALDALQWDERVAPSSILEAAVEMEEAHSDALPPEKEIIKARFQDLQDPRFLNKWVRVKATLGGRSEIPAAIPRYVKVECQSGALTKRRQCDLCRLPDRQFTCEMAVDAEKQLSLLSVKTDEVNNVLQKELGIPKNCTLPHIEIESSSADEVFLTPTMEERDGKGDGNGVWGRSHGYLIAETRVDIKENVAYEFTGQVMAHPKTGGFTFAARRWLPLTDSIFNWKYDQKKWAALYDAMGPPDVVGRTVYLLDQVREYVTQIYGLDQMTLVQWLTMFMPFKFRLAQYESERVSPVTLILGDTTLGKSTITKRLTGLYGAGRVVNAGSALTHAGLIGGMITHGRDQRFVWGLIPGSNGGFLAFDEWAKIPLEMIGQMTQVFSSGVAERTTIAGAYQTRAWVRMLLMTNPRDNRTLNSFPSALDAALKVMGSTQDLGRVELCHVQYQPKSWEFLAKQKNPDPKLWTYRKEEARYHLQWAWSRTMDQIVFKDVQHLFDSSLALSSELGHTTLLLPTIARFKVGRVAAAVAALVLSSDEHHNLVVKREHVEYAISLMRTCYSPFIKNASIPSLDWACPDSLIRMFRKVKNRPDLQLFVTHKQWTTEDIQSLIGHSDGHELLRLLHFEVGLIRKIGQYYYPTDSRLSDVVMAFLNNDERERELTP